MRNKNDLYDWTRYWIPLEGVIQLDEYGFPHDPQGEFGQYHDFGFSTLEQMEQEPLLLLLGEPGMGKSTLLGEERERLVQKGSGKVIFKELRYMDNSGWLRDNIFQHNTVAEWIQQDSQEIMYLLLDGLDESGIGPELTLGNILGLIKDYAWPLCRLRLRITCRTADWPFDVLNSNNIKELCPGNDSGISCFQEIVPLTRKDVLKAAESKLNDDSEAFFAEVERLGAASMASKPLTLEMLLDEFLKNRTLPTSRKELYETACLKICGETTEARAKKRTLSGRELLVAAGRIATVTLLSSENEIFRMPQGTDRLSVEDLSWGQEIIDGRKFPVNSNAIWEMLGTGLFWERGENARGWAHQSYQEFLAAWYLHWKQLSLNQLLNLLIHPLDDTVVPQLEETASWLVSMNPNLFPEILEKDPLVLLRTDSLPAEQRGKLAIALLSRIDWGSLPFEKAISIRPYLRNLKHDGLSDILRPYLIAESSTSSQRLFALQIAVECGLPDLKEDISTLLLDPNKDSDIRVKAALALEKIGVEKNIDVFKTLLDELSSGRQPDPDHRLRGLILSFLWPTNLTSQELFQLLIPLESKVYGSYRRFLTTQTLFGHAWGKKDIKSGLQWMLKTQTLPENLDPIYFAFNEIMDALIVKGLSFIEDEDFLHAYLSALQTRHAKEGCLIHDNKSLDEFKKIFQNADARIQRQFIQGAIEALGEKVYRELYGSVLLHVVKENDLCWVLSQTKSCYENKPESPVREKEIKRWCYLSSMTFNSLNIDHIETVLGYCRDIPPLAGHFKDLVEMSKTKSPEQIVRGFEESRNKSNAMQQARQHKIIDPPPSKGVMHCLDQIEKGHPEQWPPLLCIMSLTQNGNTGISWNIDDITTLPGWQEASNATKNRIVDAAAAFLEEVTVPSRDLGSESINQQEFSVFVLQAFLFLCKERPEKFASLSTAAWSKGIPFILDLWNLLNGDSQETFTDIIFIEAFKKDRATYLSTLRKFFLKNRDYYFLQKMRPCISPCWCDDISDLLAGLLGEVDLSIGSYSAILSLLIKHGDERGITEAEKLLEGKSRTDFTKEYAVEAIKILLKYPDQRNWKTFWSYISRFPGIVRELFQSETYCPDSSFLTDERLTESDLGDFFLWLHEQFPYEKDSTDAVKSENSEGNSFCSILLRDRTLNALVNLGTIESVSELERIRKELPELKFLDSYLEKARENTCRCTWRPLSVQQIRTLFENSDCRMVHSEGQFMDVLIESLERMEKELQGETRRSVLLWNECKEGHRPLFEPKQEVRFSDDVKRHLQKDLIERGIIIDREVEIQAATTPKSGQRLDIYARAVSIDQHPQRDCVKVFSVKIEIKGSWNHEVEKAMETQLVDRYLKENNSQHGIYLVGWFDCDKGSFRNWQNKKPRCWKTIEKARSALQEQAKSLSRDGIDVRPYVMDVSL